MNNKRIPVIAGNWKMFKTTAEALALVQELAASVDGASGREIVICPPFTALSSVKPALAGTNIKLGAQNLNWEAQGAFTGEISAPMLKDVGCEYVIIGHSERRQFFAETDENVSRKLKAALSAGLIPIVCVGESLAEREAGITSTVVGNQIKLGLAGLSPNDAKSIIIAYEPIWAIGTGRTATAADANAMCSFIRLIVTGMFGTPVADSMRIQYGGSVKPDNIDELMATSDIDGALVGGASLKAADFARIVNFVTPQ
ncbi:MAG: triose-phosphate isomerase [Negativicutes bacterium]